MQRPAALAHYLHILLASDLGHLTVQPHSISRSINIRLKCRYCSLHAQTSTVAFNNGSHYADYHWGDNHDVKAIAATRCGAGGAGASAQDTRPPAAARPADHIHLRIPCFLQLSTHPTVA